MKKKMVFTMVLLIVLATTACSLGEMDQPEPAATVTLTEEAAMESTDISNDSGETEVAATIVPAIEEPTLTPTSTATETPTPTETETPTLETTPTETSLATPDPEEGLGGIRYDERFDGSSGWGWTYIEDGVVRFGIDSGGVLAAFEEANNGWRISLGPDTYSGADQRVQITARAVVCGDQDEWGLLFRGTFTEKNQFNGYIYKLNCAGQVRVERLEENQSSVLLGWVQVEDVETGTGSENSLMVWAVGEEMRFYVNNIYVDTVIDGTYGEGIYGIYAQDRTDGNAEFLYIAMRVHQVALE